jgi:hypothetical protein
LAQPNPSACSAVGRTFRIVEVVMNVELNPPLRPEELAAFERQYNVSLPPDYRDFLLSRGNGGMLGPRYGLLRLGEVPEHWKGVHDYDTQLRRSFPLTAEWVWEDEDENAADLEARVAAVDDGVVLLGEEGCGARWTLVLRGTEAGRVWLSTGEGATPTGMTFLPWLERLSRDGFSWWATLVEEWGPKRGIWFASHAIKQLYVSGHPGDLAQSSPLCVDCVHFLSRACAHDQRPLAVQTPAGRWLFSSKGEIANEE